MLWVNKKWKMVFFEPQLSQGPYHFWLFFSLLSLPLPSHYVLPTFKVGFMSCTVYISGSYFVLLDYCVCALVTKRFCMHDYKVIDPDYIYFPIYLQGCHVKILFSSCWTLWFIMIWLGVIMFFTIFNLFGYYMIDKLNATLYFYFLAVVPFAVHNDLSKS